MERMLNRVSIGASKKDRTILRELAKEVADIAALPVQKERADLWRRINRLEKVRPPIRLPLCYATWGEIKKSIPFKTDDPWARTQEEGLRYVLTHYELIHDDFVIEDKVLCPMVISGMDYGISLDTETPPDEYGAAHYKPVITRDDEPGMVTMPRVALDKEETNRRYEAMMDVFDGILEVELQGVGPWLTYMTMDDFVRWRGFEETFADMLDRPEWLHAWMNRMLQWQLSRLDQCERLGLLTFNTGHAGIGTGGLTYTDELPQTDFDGKHVRAKDLWGFATTQIFAEVSPAMHEEFALRYEKQFLSRFGLAIYGCCEPLDRKLDIVKQIPNLRKVAISPWADLARSAEALGDKYVISYRPHPGIFAAGHWNIGCAREQLCESLEKARGCVIEIQMSDVNNCRGEPHRLTEWSDMAMNLVKEYGAQPGMAGNKR